MNEEGNVYLCSKCGKAFKAKASLGEQDRYRDKTPRCVHVITNASPIKFYILICIQ